VSITKAAPPGAGPRDPEAPPDGAKGEQQGWQFSSPLVLTMLLILVVSLQGPIRRAA
jgi:hypothetical protein